MDSKDNLWHRDSSGSYYHHNTIGGSARRPIYNSEGVSHSESTHCLIPTTTTTSLSGLHNTGFAQIMYRSIRATNTSPTYHQWLHHDTNLLTDTTELAAALNDGSAIIVSDGSYHSAEQLGTAAWIITDSQYNTLAQGLSISPGDPDIQSAYRSEVLGGLAVFDYISSHPTLHLNNNAAVKFYCDNKSVVNVVGNWTTDRMTPKHDHADLVSALLQVRDNLGITVTSHHVRAHQEEKIPYELLTPIERLNVAMDRKAKDLIGALINCSNLRASDSPHPHSFPQCSWNNEIIHHNLHHTLYYRITHEKMEQYWIEKKRVREEVLTSIDTTSLAKASKTVTLPRQRFLAKWSCECLPTGKNMVRWKLRHDGACPFCTLPNENTTHILTCNHVDALAVWDEAILKFLNNAFGYDTCWYVRLAISRELTAWRHNLPSPDLSYYPALLQQAVQEQRTIGWKQFLEGIISKRWRLYMHLLFQEQGEGHSSGKWVCNLLKGLWNLLFHIWNGRNQQLHKTQRIKDLEGLPLLKQAIRQEWNKGLGLVPASEFSRFLSPAIDDILKRGEESLKLWFLTVRQGRILFDQRNLIQDDFSSSKALQQWIGLSYTLTDDEVLPVLDKSISMEKNIGLNNIQNEQIQQLLSYSMLPHPASTLEYKKEWFCLVRQARRLYDSKNVHRDEFDTSTLHQTWLENNTQI